MVLSAEEKIMLVKRIGERYGVDTTDADAAIEAYLSKFCAFYGVSDPNFAKNMEAWLAKRPASEMGVDFGPQRVEKGKQLALTHFTELVLGIAGERSVSV